MFSQLKIVNAKLFTQMAHDYLNALVRITHDSTSLEKIKETAVDKLRNIKQRIV